jgi:Tfp pilus assembly protein PilV
VPATFPAFRATGGFTLAETAGALLMLAVAILGIAALHLENRQIHDTLDLHDRAIALAIEMSGKISANKDAKARYETAVGIVCPPEQLRARNTPLQEVACWQDKVAAQLPSGTGRIGRESNAGQLDYTITVSWSQPGAGTASFVARLAH